jgi:DNA-binding response OmpR family regulator
LFDSAPANCKKERWAETPQASGVSRELLFNRPSMPDPLKILLVEDHEDTLRLMARLLRHLGYTVEAAATLNDARALAEKIQFGLMISDLALPDGNGTDLMRELRQKQGLMGIALTGFDSADDVEHALRAGFHSHLTKPVDLEKLEAAIQDVMNGKG